MKLRQQFPLHSATISFLAVTAAGTDDAEHQVTDGTRGSPEQPWQGREGEVGGASLKALVGRGGS